MQYTKRAIVYFAGDVDYQIFLLQQGLIALDSTDIETNAPVADYVRPGEFLGIKSALGHFPREETATVLDDSVVIALTIIEFEQLISSNKDLMTKMLQAFSNQLRTLHRKTEAILQSTAVVDGAPGMFDVARSFYADNQYLACCNICERLIKLFPDSPETSVAAALLKDAKMRHTQFRREPAKQGDMEDPSDMFVLPAFDRFAKKYKPGEVIIAEYEPGQTFYFIRTGLIQSVKCVKGIKKNLDILRPGEFFGEMAILENTTRSATCVAITDVDVLEFTKENFELLITGNPQMAVILLKLFCKRIYDQQRRFKILCIPDVSIRIADVILLFDEMSSSFNPLDKKRNFDLSVQDIAHWAGIPVDAAKVEIKKYIDARRLEVFDDHITVTNIADIRRIVDTRFQARRPAQ
jgi:CRP-like cAMP-binding protein